MDRRPDLHAAIMNLPHDAEARLQQYSPVELFAYRFGHRDARHAAAELAQEHTAALIAENARLREALRLIATPGYGIELGDTDDVRAEYWSEQTEKCRCIARAALAEREAARQFYESCEEEARDVMRNRSEK